MIDPHVQLQPDSDRLKGWKDIASYLQSSVRTVQRWERALKMPVHRIEAQGNGVIFASRRELDEWLASAEGRSAVAESTPSRCRGTWRAWARRFALRGPPACRGPQRRAQSLVGTRRRRARMCRGCGGLVADGSQHGPGRDILGPADRRGRSGRDEERAGVVPASYSPRRSILNRRLDAGGLGHGRSARRGAAWPDAVTRIRQAGAARLPRRREDAGGAAAAHGPLPALARPRGASPGRTSLWPRHLRVGLQSRPTSLQTAARQVSAPCQATINDDK